MFQQYDSQGNLCGEGKAKDFPQTYFQWDTTSQTTYCIATCPSAEEYTAVLEGPSYDKHIYTDVSQDFIGNLCVPQGSIKNVVDMFAKSSFSGIITELPQFGKQLPLFGIIAFVLTMMYICMLKKCAKAFIMICQAIWILGLFALTVQGIMDYGNIKFISGIFGKSQTWTVCDMILNWIFILSGPLYFLLFVCWIQHQLKIAASIIEAGCDAFGDIPSCLLVPVFTLVFMLGNGCIWVFIMLSIMGDHVTGQTKGHFQPGIDMTSAADWFMFQTFFNLVQWICFWSSFGQYMLCSMFSTWYYFQDGVNDLDGPPNAFGSALKRATVCMGTIAIGNLIITIATMIRIILFIFTAEQKATGEADGCVKKCFYGFLNCMAWVIEKICQQFTKQGQIHSSFTAEGFCSSAWTSMCVNLQNIGIFSIVQLTETLMSTGGNLVVCVFNMVLANLMFTKWMDFGLTAPPYATLMLIGVMSQLINSAVLSVWDLATDTVMYCFFFDQDRKGEPPVNQPFQLKDSLEDIIATKKQHDAESDSQETLLNA